MQDARCKKQGIESTLAPYRDEGEKNDSTKGIASQKVLSGQTLADEYAFN